jgi:5-methylcytosine-specific restriction protein A
MSRLTTLKPKLQGLKPGGPTSLTTSATRTRGSAWVKTRDRILRRDCGVCQCDECKRTGSLRLASEVDHRTPIWEGGSDDDANLQAINGECHRRKSAEEAGRRGR